MKLDSRYVDYFKECSNYSVRDLKLFNFMYGITNSGNLFSDELTEWLLEVGFIQSQCQMSIYYKYAPDGNKFVLLSYVDECVYWYTYKALGKWLVADLRKIYHVTLLVCAHWFMSIRLYQMKDYYISVYQDRLINRRWNNN